MNTRLNLEQIRAFLTVVRLGGFSKAADELGLTQPAVTTRIKNLENTLGVELFERTSGGVLLTKRGDILARYAKQFEQLSELVQRDVMDPSGIEGHLRLGVSETIVQCWLPLFIEELHRMYPALEIEINVDISVNLRTMLLDREIDLAVLLGPISEYSVDNVELPEVDLAWYRAESDQSSNDQPSRYLEKPIFTYARNTRPFRELRSELLEHLGPNYSLFPSSSLSACFRLVESGLGVAALPRVLGQRFVSEGRICEFDPGWRPNPLKFSASFLGEPKSHLLETAAAIASATARSFDDKKL
ncbi:LysR family transcriptional regulator [Phaeobacter sp. JH18-32]|uniref:LysR family transcriptional regulator n=2 Tax=Roseobacteraceae TaxID=2854170 RepID=UPI003A89D115